MRKSFVSAAGLAAMLTLTCAVWPLARSATSLGQVAAQDETTNTPIPAAALAPTLDDATRRAETALWERGDFEFIDVPLGDALVEIGDQVGLQFHVKTNALDELGISSDAPVNLALKDVRVETALDMLLDPLGLAHVVHDGVVVVTSLEDLESFGEVRVHNCRDLFELATPASEETGCIVFPDFGELPATSGFLEKAAKKNSDAKKNPDAKKANNKKGRSKTKGKAAAPAEQQSSLAIASPDVLAQFGGGQPPAQASIGSVRRVPLIDVITNSIEPDSWDEVGGPGTITDFDGLLVIRQNPRVHRRVEQLLEMLREESAKQPWTNPPDAADRRSRGTNNGGGFF